MKVFLGALVAALAVNALWSGIDGFGDAAWSVLIAVVIATGSAIGERTRNPRKS